jgi:hypothetical protein
MVENHTERDPLALRCPCVAHMDWNIQKWVVEVVDYIEVWSDKVVVDIVERDVEVVHQYEEWLQLARVPQQ